MRSWLLLLGLGVWAVGCVGAETGGESADATEEDTSAGTLFVAVGVNPGGGDLPSLTKVKLADRKTTKCDDGELHASCAVLVDYSDLNLTDAKESHLRKEFNAKHAILQGKIVPATVVSPTVPAVAVLKVTAAWMGATNSAPKSSEKFFRAHDRIQSADCANTFTCPKINLHTLNTKSTASDIAVEALDFSISGASKTEITKAQNLMEIGAVGLLVRGNTYFGNGWGSLAMTEFFLPVAKGKTPQGQMCGGIANIQCPSGQFCEGAGPADESGICRAVSN